MLLAEALSWSLFAFIVFILVGSRARALDKVFTIIIVTMPILAPSVASQVFLRGNIYRLISVVIVLVLTLRFDSLWKTVANLWFVRLYLAFLVVCLISAMVSVEPVESVFRSLTYLEPLFYFFLAFVVAHEFPKGFEVGNKAIFTSLVMALAYGVFQIITQSDPLLEIGFRNHMTTTLFNVNYLEDKRTFSGRITSVFGQPVYAAFFFIATSHVLFYKFITARRGHFFHLALVFILLLAIFTTGTRAAYVVIALVLFLVMLHHGLRSLKFVFSVAIVVLLFVGVVLQDETVEYVRRSFDLSRADEFNANAFQRLALTGRLLELALESPSLGLGPGYVQKAATGTLTSYNPGFEGLGGQENHFFVILADTGVVGTVVYLMFLWTWFASLKRVNRGISSSLDTYRSLLLIVLFCFFLGSFTVANLVSVPMIFLFVSYGLYVGKVAQNSEIELSGR
ncbi:MAG: O-antigen ligase family protein [Candidatus Nitrosotenuis sp.]